MYVLSRLSIDESSSHLLLKRSRLAISIPSIFVRKFLNFQIFEFLDRKIVRSEINFDSLKNENAGDEIPRCYSLM